MRRDFGPILQVHRRTEKQKSDRWNAQQLVPVTRPCDFSHFLTKIEGRNRPSIGNGWPGQGNIRPVTFEVVSRPDAISNSVEDFLKGFASRLPDGQLTRLGMEHNTFGKRARWLLQDASKHACNGAVQHVSFSDANVTVFVQFFQLPINELPSKRRNVDAVAVVDCKTMSAADVPATYIGFKYHAYLTAEEARI